MYSIESLKECNQAYEYKHRITQKDVDMANSHISVIESTRTEESPQPGDLLRYTDAGGDYYHYSRIEKIDYASAILCGYSDTSPWIHCKYPDLQIYSVSVSGGSRFWVPIAKPRLIGKDEAGFKDWGRFGSCGGGTIFFMAQVNVWEYTEPDAMFPPEYTTKHWRKQYLFFCTEAQAAESSQFVHRIKGDGVAFHTQKDYLEWLHTFNGVEFDGYCSIKKTIFLYHEKDYYISREEWDALNLPLDTRMCNGTIIVKVRYDNENHRVHTYRFTNDGAALRQLGFGPYELTKGTDLSVLLNKI